MPEISIMPAYIILGITITDPEVFDQYKQLAPTTIKAYGGKYIARVAMQEHWRAIGHPTASLSKDSTVLTRPRPGSIHRNSKKPAPSDIRRPSRAPSRLMGCNHLPGLINTRRQTPQLQRKASQTPQSAMRH
jgi:hypothetical protein